VLFSPTPTGLDSTMVPTIALRLKKTCHTFAFVMQKGFQSKRKTGSSAWAPHEKRRTLCKEMGTASSLGKRNGSPMAREIETNSATRWAAERGTKESLAAHGPLRHTSLMLLITRDSRRSQKRFAKFNETKDRQPTRNSGVKVS